MSSIDDEYSAYMAMNDRNKSVTANCQITAVADDAKVRWLL
jgi:hypothetical protein